MRKLKQKIRHLFEEVYKIETNLVVWTFSFLGIMTIREFLENFLSGQSAIFEEIITDYLHNMFFFGLSFLFVLIILGWLLKTNPSRIKNVLLVAFWLVIFPPIIDMARTGGEVFWSFYLLSDLRALGLQFITFFGHLPPGIVYFGTKIVFASAIILIASFVFLISRNILKALFSAFFVYAALFFMGSFPTWGAFFYYFATGAKKISDINSIDIISIFAGFYPLFGIEFNNFKYSLAHNLNLLYYPLLLFIASILFFWINREKFLAVLKNTRLPQVIYHFGLFFTGTGLGYLAYTDNFHLNFFSLLAIFDLLIAIWLAWIASVIVNDIYDFKVDETSNPQRPLQQGIFNEKEYWELGVIFFMLSLLGGTIVSLKFAALLFVYQILAWAYSAPPYRLKKFPVLATFMSAAASLIILFLGFTLFSGDNNLQGLSWKIILLFLISFTLVLPLKDFKDVAGDKKCNIWTIPVIFGEEKGRLINAIGIFIPFVLSVIFLNEFRLFWWALLFGSVSFLIIMTKKPRQLFWWVLGITTLYGLILTKIIFF
jgi:chlorophyll synthase